MSAPLFRSFDRLEDATMARGELAAAGFPATSVELRVLANEARGAVAGNFAAGNGAAGSGGVDRSSARASPGSDDKSNLADPVYRGLHILVVEAHEDAERKRAVLILDRFGGVEMATTGSSGAAPPPAG